MTGQKIFNSNKSTPCVNKSATFIFLNNSVKHWPILLIFVTQHHEKT